MKEAKQRQSQPVDLSLCLKGFTKEEEIAEWLVNNKYYVYAILFQVSNL